MDARRYRAGVDSGGTFADLLLLDERTWEMIIGRVLTTSGDPSVAVVQGQQAPHLTASKTYQLVGDASQAASLNSAERQAL